LRSMRGPRRFVRSDRVDWPRTTSLCEPQTLRIVRTSNNSPRSVRGILLAAHVIPNSRFYEDTFVKPSLITAWIGRTSSRRVNNMVAIPEVRSSRGSSATWVSSLRRGCVLRLVGRSMRTGRAR
jgi:hypothetical protein